MAKDKRGLYEMEVNGETRTFRFDQEDAERYGDAARRVSAVAAPETDEEGVVKPARTRSRRSRKAVQDAANKGVDTDILGDK